jgi:hypothetical protein
MVSVKTSYALIIWFVLAFPVSCNTLNPGCNDPQASNFDPSATSNDGCCIYDTVYVAPSKTMALSMVLEETSGLILWDGLLWTHNDNSDTRLYGLDTATAEIVKTHILWKVENYDWEEISQDDEFIYLGDFGNNGSGNRKDLHILRVEKNSLKSGKPAMDTIWFTYSDQTDFSPSAPNQTEFDCEAFVVTSDSIYLFTKQWQSANTTVYALSREPGDHVAKKTTTYAIAGLVTGATYLEEKGLLVLCGYTGLLQPFLHLLYDYPDHQFFSGNKRRLNLSLPFHQVEGIATEDGLKYYISNEYFSHQPSGINILQKLHVFDLGPYLREYLERD